MLWVVRGSVPMRQPKWLPKTNVKVAVWLISWDWHTYFTDILTQARKWNCQPKYVLRVVKGTISMRLFKCIPKTNVKANFWTVIGLTYIFTYYRHFDTNVEMKSSTYVCCGYSKEPSQWDCSNGYLKQILEQMFDICYECGNDIINQKVCCG